MRNKEAIMRGPRPQMAIILINNIIKRPLYGFGLGLHPRTFCAFLSLV
jgi:hypothetical protein